MSKESKAKYRELDAKNKEAQCTTLSKEERMALCDEIFDKGLKWMLQIVTDQKAGGSGGCATALDCVLRVRESLNITQSGSWKKETHHTVEYQYDREQ